MCMYIHISPSLKGNYKSQSDTISRKLFCAIVAQNIREVPPIPSNSGYRAIPFLTLFFFTHEYSRYVQYAIHFPSTQFSRTIDAKPEVPPVILLPRSF